MYLNDPLLFDFLRAESGEVVLETKRFLDLKVGTASLGYKTDCRRKRTGRGGFAVLARNIVPSVPAGGSATGFGFRNSDTLSCWDEAIP
jgi:hypothetical protein